MYPYNRYAAYYKNQCFLTSMSVQNNFASNVCYLNLKVTALGHTVLLTSAAYAWITFVVVDKCDNTFLYVKG